jgi:A/G-specific adenine glycosylase
LRKREGKGLLAGMTELPTSAWSARADGDVSVTAAPLPAAWRSAGEVEHGFTHFTLRLSVFRADGVETAKAPPGHWWSRPAEIEGEALPTVMRKALACAMPAVPPTRKKP